jgi:aspartate/methionine/tyrosine aminotransferase
LGAELQRKRALLEPSVAALGLPVLPAQGTYFLVADVARYMLDGEDDVAFCRRLAVEGGVSLIPVSAFYYSEHRPRSLVRFCFCKDDAKLTAASSRLQAYLGGRGSSTDSRDQAGEPNSSSSLAAHANGAANGES